VNPRRPASSQAAARAREPFSVLVCLLRWDEPSRRGEPQSTQSVVTTKSRGLTVVFCLVVVFSRLMGEIIKLEVRGQGSVLRLCCLTTGEGHSVRRIHQRKAYTLGRKSVFLS